MIVTFTWSPKEKEEPNCEDRNERDETEGKTRKMKRKMKVIKLR